MFQVEALNLQSSFSIFTVNVCGRMNGHVYSGSHICGLCVNVGELAVHVGVHL